MKPKNIIITNTTPPDIMANENFTFFNSNSLRELTERAETIKNIYIDENILLENPEITSTILKLNAPPKIVIEDLGSITQKFSKATTYENNTKIPLKIERIISEFLKECMIKNNHSGYFYLTHALFILFLDSSSIYNVKKNIYFPIEIRFDTAEESVERCIKYAIKQGYSLSDKYSSDNIFKKFTTIPSNKTFLETSFLYLKKNFPEFGEFYFLNK